MEEESLTIRQNIFQLTNQSRQLTNQSISSIFKQFENFKHQTEQTFQNQKFNQFQSLIRSFDQQFNQLTIQILTLETQLIDFQLDKNSFIEALNQTTNQLTQTYDLLHFQIQLDIHQFQVDIQSTIRQFEQLFQLPYNQLEKLIDQQILNDSQFKKRLHLFDDAEVIVNQCLSSLKETKNRFEIEFQSIVNQIRLINKQMRDIHQKTIDQFDTKLSDLIKRFAILRDEFKNQSISELQQQLNQQSIEINRLKNNRQVFIQKIDNLKSTFQTFKICTIISLVCLPLFGYLLAKFNQKSEKKKSKKIRSSADRSSSSSHQSPQNDRNSRKVSINQSKSSPNVSFSNQNDQNWSSKFDRNQNLVESDQSTQDDSLNRINDENQ